MENIKIYQVDAFTSKLFKGNSAAVCPLNNWLSDEIMQSIAMENNLSETAFFFVNNNKYHIRWFTPKCEIDLAGHPTLAAAHIIFKELCPGKNIVEFNTKIGDLLTVYLKKDILSLDFPSYLPTLDNSCFEEISTALNSKPLNVYFSRYAMAVYEREEDILKISPNYEALKYLKYNGIIVTAKGNNCDFVSRFFAPKFGIMEDPVTGSAHCELIPHWSKMLNKKEMIARQLSHRGGELYCSYKGKRVTIAGKAITYMRGELLL